MNENVFRETNVHQFWGFTLPQKAQTKNPVDYHRYRSVYEQGSPPTISFDKYISNYTIQNQRKVCSRSPLTGFLLIVVGVVCVGISWFWELLCTFGEIFRIHSTTLPCARVVVVCNIEKQQEIIVCY